MTAFLHAINPSGQLVPIKCDADGKLYVEGSLSLDASDINIGNVDIVSLPALPAGTNNIGDVDILSLPAHLGTVAASSILVSESVARAADTTAYAAKDVVSTAVGYVMTFAGMGRVVGGSGTIVKARLMTSQKTCTAQFRLHLFHTAPTAVADNVAYPMLWTNATNRVGMIDFPACASEDTSTSTAAATMRPSSDGSYSAPNLWYKCAGADTALYGLLETLTVFTPDNAQAFLIELGAERN